MGLPKNDGEDFGQTLGFYGVNSGPYVVIPFFGPSTMRDAPSRVVDRLVNPINEVDHVPTRNTIYGVELLSTRADLLEAEKFIRGDRYTFIRDAYLQRRKFLRSFFAPTLVLYDDVVLFSGGSLEVGGSKGGRDSDTGGGTNQMAALSAPQELLTEVPAEQEEHEILGNETLPRNDRVN